MQYRPNRQQETFSKLNEPTESLTILCDVTHTCLCPLCPAVQGSPEIVNIFLKCFWGVVLFFGFFLLHIIFQWSLLAQKALISQA